MTLSRFNEEKEIAEEPCAPPASLADRAPTEGEEAGNSKATKCDGSTVAESYSDEKTQLLFKDVVASMKKLPITRQVNLPAEESVLATYPAVAKMLKEGRVLVDASAYWKMAAIRWIYAELKGGRNERVSLDRTAEIASTGDNHDDLHLMDVIARFDYPVNVILLGLSEGKSVMAIARDLGIPREKARKYIRDAKPQLRKLLGDGA